MEPIKLNFTDVFLKIVDDYHLTDNDIASIFHCSPFTVRSYLSGRTKINIEKALLLKQFLLDSYGEDIYDKYIFDFDDAGYLFHGSRMGIKGKISPNYLLSREKTDFGRGFYLGESFKQSSTFVAEESDGLDRIYQFEFDKTNLKILELNDLDWIFYIGYNRNKIADNKNNHKLLLKMKAISSGDYDVIIGSIADDKMSQNMEDFFSDRISYGQILKCLTQLKIGKQFCLLTQKACDRLKCINAYLLDNTYRYLIRVYAFEQRKSAVNSAYKITSSKDDNGLYFSELVKKYGGR